MLGPAMARFADQQQGQGQSGAEYTPAQTRATYSPAFSSQQTAQPGIQGLPQQMAPQAPQGLQGLMSQIMARYQNPYQMQMRAPMPQYMSSALNYRPDITGAQQNLSRVAPSVAEQQRLQAIEDARIAAEQATNSDDADFQAWQRQQYENSKYVSQQS
jgi:hypothetical protein